MVVELLLGSGLLYCFALFVMTFRQHKRMLKNKMLVD